MGLAFVYTIGISDLSQGPPRGSRLGLDEAVRLVAHVSPQRTPNKSNLTQDAILVRRASFFVALRCLQHAETVTVPRCRCKLRAEYLHDCKFRYANRLFLS